MIKTPVLGMKDILPDEMSIRMYLLNNIRNVYKSFGFLEIATPTIEHIENLNGSKGWENEKLIFKILKRGDKLEKALESDNKNDIVDSGLRYDLTLPLSRFYASNKDSLPKPFKAIQIGNVYRADRPQKGRFREFTQCDIDVFGDSTFLSEIECLTATITFLKKIGFDKYGIYIDINDRRILKKIILDSGFDETQFDDICIILDKTDKIGLDGVRDILKEESYDEQKVNKLLNTINNIKLEDSNDEIFTNLKYISETVKKLTGIDINFLPTLVRGMGYYTGPIFEVKCKEFSSSIGGGGRYDKMIGDFVGEDVPACGISLGFERLITILQDKSFTINNGEEKVAYLLDKNLDKEKIVDILKEVNEKRLNGTDVYVSNMAKNIKFQKDNLLKLGFTNFVDYKA